jgi:hypothetical protein
MDHPTLLPRDSAMKLANHAKAEWLKKAKEDKMRKRQQKLRARE